MVFYPVTAPLRQMMRKKDPLLRPAYLSPLYVFSRPYPSHSVSLIHAVGCSNVFALFRLSS